MGDTRLGKDRLHEKVEELRGQLNEYVADQTDSEYLQALRNSELANKIRKDQIEFITFRISMKVVESISRR